MHYHKGKTYSNTPLHKDDMDANPIVSLNQWIKEAEDAGIEDYNAFHLSTSDIAGNVSGRIVLLKSIENDKIIFFTDYSSKKGIQIANNNKVAATFYWGALERQIRIEGTIGKISNQVNDKYFTQRPRASQAAAIASNQSTIIENRKMLESKYQEILNRSEKLKRPVNWGGYQINAKKIEFWQGRPSRLNDRIIFIYERNGWKIERLSP